MTNSFFNMVTSSDNSIRLDNNQQKALDNSTVPILNTDSHKLTSEQWAGKTTFRTESDSDMPADARRALIYLSQQGVVLHSSKPQLFDNIVRHQASMRRHLSEIYCSLIIDEHSGVAFVARADFVAENHEQLAGLDKFDNDIEQAELGDEDITSMIQKRTLTVYDTLLLLNLRKYYQERQNLGETEIIIDIEKLESLMSPFLPLTDHGSKDKKKLSGRLEFFAKNHKLVAIKRGNAERYKITPMIRYVVNASLLQAMLNEYKALLGETPDEDADTDFNTESNNAQKNSGVVNRMKNDTVTDSHFQTNNPVNTLEPIEKPSTQQDSLF